MATTFGHFDADVHRAAQTEPTLTIGRLVYRGRLLSIEEWLEYSEAIEQLRADKAGPRAFIALYRRYLRAVFPRRRYRFWAPDPVAHLMAMPWGVVTEAMARFFALQVLATKPSEDPETPEAPTPSSGTDSKPRTPPPSSDSVPDPTT